MGTVPDSGLEVLRKLVEVVDGDPTSYQMRVTLENGAAFVADRAIVSNSGGLATSSSVTSTELGYLTGVQGNIQEQFVSVPGGRLTAVTGVASPITNVFNVGTIYYTPYLHGRISLYNGTNWTVYEFAELSNIFTNSSTGNAGPAATANSSNYDLFVWNNGGTITLTRGPAWTSSTARGTGSSTTELEVFEGVYVNKIDITNGPAARRGRYVGSFRTNGTATLTSTYTQAAAGGGTNNQIMVWNMYNRILAHSFSRDSTDSWSMSSTTIRAANSSNSNRISYIVGMAEDSVYATYTAPATGGATSSANVFIGLDSVTAFVGVPGSTNAGGFGTATAFYFGHASLGAHYVQALESVTSGGDAVTFYGDNGAPTATQMGLMFLLMM